MSEKMREEFERAVVRDWADCLSDLTRNGDGYESHHIEAAWWAWRESRESLVVDLTYCILPHEFVEAVKDFGLRVKL